jgi:hypothetical protein
VEEWLAAVPSPVPYEKEKDLYGKVIELYCLGLLPRNKEWEFARTFIGMNEYLSKSRKEVQLFLIYLKSGVSKKARTAEVGTSKRKTSLCKTAGDATTGEDGTGRSENTVSINSILPFTGSC